MVKGFLRVFERLLWSSLSLFPATKCSHVGSFNSIFAHTYKGLLGVDEHGNFANSLAWIMTCSIRSWWVSYKISAISACFGKFCLEMNGVPSYLWKWLLYRPSFRQTWPLWSCWNQPVSAFILSWRNFPKVNPTTGTYIKPTRQCILLSAKAPQRDC
jgi:hypothetical protein